MPRARIQIVEDERIIAADIEEALMGLNYDVVGKASSGKEALDLAREKKPDLILMDINIEGSMDGIDTAAIVKRELDIPVVFLTAFADTPIFNRAKEIEPQGYVMKPFRQTELRTVIDLALHKHGQERKRKETSETPETPQSPKVIPDFKQIAQLRSQLSQAALASVRSTLENTPTFENLPAEVLEKIADVCQISSLKNFDVFIHEGRENHSGFLVLAGRVAIFKRSSSGKELVVELLGPGDLFGILSMLDAPEYPFSARAQGDSQILWIPRPALQFLTEHYAEFSKEVISRVLDRLRRAHDFSRALAHDRVEIRIASTLLALESRFGIKNGDNSVDLRLTRQELAEIVGTTPETISRVFAHFVQDGILDIATSGIVKIISLKLLEDITKS